MYSRLSQCVFALAGACSLLVLLPLVAQADLSSWNLWLLLLANFVAARLVFSAYGEQAYSLETPIDVLMPVVLVPPLAAVAAVVCAARYALGHRSPARVLINFNSDLFERTFVLGVVVALRHWFDPSLVLLVAAAYVANVGINRVAAAAAAWLNGRSADLRSWLVDALYDVPFELSLTCLVAVAAAVYPASTLLMIPLLFGFFLSERHQVQLQDAEDRATTDSLTGIANRASLQEQAEQLISTCQRAGVTLGLFVLDVDDFKQVNDVHGHAFGDEVLVRTAGALQRVASRDSDVVARYGGEEFVVLTVLGAGDHVGTIGERLRAAVSDEFAGDVTVSVGGVAVRAAGTWDGAHAVFHSHFVRADQSLYTAKGSGKNRVVIAGDHAHDSSAAA